MLRHFMSMRLSLIREFTAVWKADNEQVGGGDANCYLIILLSNRQ